MPFEYEADPQKIEAESFRQIRQLTDLNGFTREQAQVVMRIVHSLGLPYLADQVRFSDKSCEAGMEALSKGADIICDVEMVKQGITKRMINKQPLCFLNDPMTSTLAKKHGETRSMAALACWKETMAGAVILIANAPTALFRLLEMLDDLPDARDKPALIIAMPVGFVGAAESKQALWDHHKNLGVECITLLGREGGSAVTAASCNALLRCHRGEYY